ncbi:nuclear transport factor 2 family protein [Baekduia soli]|uniref:Nuclear transport factor 2 family protein n=1 Tax=Baekduia soli TaxID=496014 RepID=A0A5B8U4K8_9ACTN|nr:nuclear transport factor 2 family protein [Baekduia soli]QEC48059.1 nuclear transport factor 2 family protein [Baekduia soli]
MALDRATLAAAPAAYFAAVDRKDMEGTLAWFADDARLTVQTAGLTFEGRDGIRGMFEHFFGDYSTVDHRITNLVVDEEAGKASTEQHCPHIKVDGTPDTVNTCNFFDFAPDGRFQRVVIFIDAASPLRG